MKLSNTERLMTFAATALAAMAVHAAPEPTDTITPATTPLIHTATVVVRDTVYRYIFGNPDFSFNAGDVHFLCINSNAFEYDYSVDIPNFSFIREDLGSLPSNVQRTVVAMHAQPTSEQFNNNVSELFEYEIRQYPGLAFCMCGHGHHTQVNEWFGDGVLYYECAAAKQREYLVFTLKEEGGYNYEIVEY